MKPDLFRGVFIQPGTLVLNLRNLAVLKIPSRTFFLLSLRDNALVVHQIHFLQIQLLSPPPIILGIYFYFVLSLVILLHFLKFPHFFVFSFSIEFSNGNLVLSLVQGSCSSSSNFQIQVLKPPPDLFGIFLFSA